MAQEFWILALDVRPELQKSYHQQVSTELWGRDWAELAGGGHMASLGLKELCKSLGTKARAGVSEVILFSPECIGLGQPPTLAGAEEASTHPFPSPELFSSSLLLSVRASWQRFGVK